MEVIVVFAVLAFTDCLVGLILQYMMSSSNGFHGDLKKLENHIVKIFHLLCFIVSMICDVLQEWSVEKGEIKLKC
jgi:hypothetical protein